MNPNTPRKAFTLLELLIVITIMAILATLTVITYNSLGKSQRVGGAAGMIQSAVIGTQFRATQARVPVGLRFLVDADPPGTVSGMVFIRTPPDATQGAVYLGRPDVDLDGVADPVSANGDWDDARILRGTGGTGWWQMKQAGALRDGARIYLPARNRSGPLYTVDTSQLTSTREVLVLRSRFRDNSAFAPRPAVNVLPAMSYRLQLSPFVAPSENPITFPPGILIDLNRSRQVPAYTTHFDVLFSPQGEVIGATEKLDLFIASESDVIRGFDPAVAVDGSKIVTIRPLANSVHVYPVDLTDVNGDGLADDPFQFVDRTETMP